MASGIITQTMVKRGGPSLVMALNAQSYLQHPWQNLLYVQSVHTRATDVNNSGQNPDAPLKTLKKAVSLASTGDVVVVGPRHVETVSAAAELDFNVPGMTVIGCGQGSFRPSIGTDSVVGAHWVISANNVRMDRFIIGTFLDAVTKQLSITGEDAQLNDFLLYETSLQTLTGILITNNRVRINRFRARQKTAGPVSCIEVGTGNHGLEISGAKIEGEYSQAAIYVSAAATDLLVANNVIHQLNGASNKCIECAAVASSGSIVENKLRNPTDTSLAHITMGAGCLWQLFDNKVVNNNAETGILIGTPSV